MIVAQMLMSTGFAGLIGYVMGPLKGIEAGDFRAINIVNAAQTANEMELVSSLNSRARNPVGHLILTWHRDEAVDRPKQFQAGDMVLRALGLTNHQALMVVHSEPKDGLVPGPDGRHFEMHIVINRVGLDGKVNRLSHGFARAEIAAKEISEALGFRVVPGRFNGVKIDKPGIGGKIGRVQGETGEPTLADNIRDDPELFDGLRRARKSGWEALLDAFARNGIAIEAGRQRPPRKATTPAEEPKKLRRGLIMVDVADRRRRIKLSSLDTPTEKWGETALATELQGDLSSEMLKLQNAEALRHGDAIRKRRAEAQKPVGGHSALFMRFQAEREAAKSKNADDTKARKAARSVIYEGAKAEVLRLLKIARLRRILLRGFFGKRSLAGQMLNAILDSRIDHRIAVVRQARDAELQQLAATSTRQPFPRWADWRRRHAARFGTEPRRVLAPNWLKPSATMYSSGQSGMRPFPTVRNLGSASMAADRHRRPSTNGLKPTGPAYVYPDMQMPRPPVVRKPNQPGNPLDPKRSPNIPGR